MRNDLPLPGGGTFPRDRDLVLGRILEYGLLALIIFSPLPVGSVNEWSLLAIELTVVMMAAACLLLGERPSLHPDLEGGMRWPRYAFIGLILFVALQSLPLPGGLVKLVSPGVWDFRRRFAPGVGKTYWMSLSLAPGETLRTGLEIVTFILLGWLIIRTVTRRHHIRRILVVLTALGSFEALYGLYELTTKTPRILFYKKIFSPGAATGTFVNGSHYAGYLEMIIPLTIGLVLARVDFFALGGQGLRDKLVSIGTRRLVENVALTLAVVVMSVAVLLSRSRAGLSVLVVVFLILLEGVTLHFSRIRVRRLWLRNFLLVTFGLTTAAALYVGVGATVRRFALDNLLQDNRPVFWAGTVRMIADHPWTGTGLGTFALVYPAYELSGAPQLFLAHAHNDYLEYLAELGAVGFCLLVGGVLYLAARAFLAWRVRRDPQVKALGLGLLASLAGIMIHSLTDFNLHIPANTLLFVIVLGLAIVTAFDRKR